MLKKASCSSSLFLLLFFCTLNGCNHAVINSEFGAYPNVDEYPIARETYKIPFEDGYIYKEDENATIILKFYRPTRFFTLDSDSGFHIYISGQQININEKSAFKEKVIYFIRTTRPFFHGYMSKDNIHLITSSDGTFRISGNLIGEKVIRQDVFYKIESSFVNLPLIQVNSMNELYERDDDYSRSIIKGIMENEEPKVSDP